MLAAVASGTTLMSNDRLYARPISSYVYQDANLAATALRDALRGAR
ncbi:MAG: hypothetical protein M3228_06230 [Actinomycetota bacterium]|nr:hypothetical protein [Actinomycetota bacterium]